jgi:hypothetical protein
VFERFHIVFESQKPKELLAYMFFDLLNHSEFAVKGLDEARRSFGRIEDFLYMMD